MGSISLIHFSLFFAAKLFAQGCHRLLRLSHEKFNFEDNDVLLFSEKENAFLFRKENGKNFFQPYPTKWTSYRISSHLIGKEEMSAISGLVRVIVKAISVRQRRRCATGNPTTLTFDT